jgi:hypothetical protein
MRFEQELFDIPGGMVFTERRKKMTATFTAKHGQQQVDGQMSIGHRCADLSGNVGGTS